MEDCSEYTVHVFFLLISGVVLARGLARYLRGEDCNGHVTGLWLLCMLYYYINHNRALQLIAGLTVICADRTTSGLET
jgi:hypothetical protein